MLILKINPHPDLSAGFAPSLDFSASQVVSDVAPQVSLTFSTPQAVYDIQPQFFTLSMNLRNRTQMEQIESEEDSESILELQLEDVYDQKGNLVTIGRKRLSVYTTVERLAQGFNQGTSLNLSSCFWGAGPAAISAWIADYDECEDEFSIL